MAIDVRIRSITSLPRGGFDASGTAANQKAVSVGDIDITTYTANGEPLTAIDVGLETIDGIFISVIDVDGSLPTATNIHGWGYDRGNELLLLTDGSGGVTDAGSNAQVRFVAVGDTASAPELA